MTSSPVNDAGAPESEARCDCGGTLVAGSMALPLLGSPRFACRLGTTEVTTEVMAFMCSGCGTVRLRGRHPERIRNATAARKARRQSLRLPRVADSTEARGPETESR
ncbi:hypothetical protein ITI46_07615 [Streptomyces oryzae]|uniref:Uncharacterized protein n=1 Tax=Streptomyces oryzae TaxID=1434886 RepID=A0ABS3X8A4_9ACTN|nr:hypothetical protein [Streptomyces oryzae]MBO8191559.1 hypothetical protein [Streptomyces oryzae]